MELLVIAAVFVPFSALVMNAFAGDAEDDFDFSDGIQDSRSIGFWSVSYDPVGLAGGESPADGI